MPKLLLSSIAAVLVMLLCQCAPAGKLLGGPTVEERQLAIASEPSPSSFGSWSVLVLRGWRIMTLDKQVRCYGELLGESFSRKMLPDQRQYQRQRAVVPRFHRVVDGVACGATVVSSVKRDRQEIL